MKVSSKNRKFKLIIGLVFVYIFLIVCAKYVSFAETDMRGLPLKTHFKTGAPYYKGGDSSELHIVSDPNHRFNHNIEQYKVQDILIKKIHHANASLPRAVYCIDRTAEFPGSSNEAYTFKGKLDENFNIPQYDVNGDLHWIEIDATKRGQLRWLFDQFYFSENQSMEIRKAVRKFLLTETAKYTLTAAGTELTPQKILEEYNRLLNTLSDADIESVQQWALWDLINGVYVANYNGGMPEMQGHTYNMSTEQVYMRSRVKLYKYLYNTAKTKTADYKNSIIEPTLTADSSKQLTLPSNGFLNYGYKIEIPSTGENNSQNKSIVTSVTLKDANGNEIDRSKYDIGFYSGNVPTDQEIQNVLPKENTLWDTVNEGFFYIKFTGENASYQDQNALMKLEIKYRNIITYPFVYVPDAPLNQQERVQQAVAVLDRDSESKTLETQITPPKGFDLALRKSIVSVDGKSDFPSRLPVVDSSNLLLTSNDPVNSEYSTAKYFHRKDPLQVRKKSRIVYAFNIYNEDKQPKDLVAIRDRISSKLKLVPKSESTINTNYPWKEVGTNLLELKIDEIQNVNINKTLAPATPENDGAKINGKITVYLELEVGTDVENWERLTNIGEIVKDLPEGKDRDSSVNNNVSSNEYTDEKLKMYRGHSGNKIDQSDSNYFYKGIEDDDDYENVVVVEPKLDLTLKKFINTIQHKSGVHLDLKAEREPQVDIQPLKAEEYNASYTKNLVYPTVYEGSIVRYIIRVYNEGMHDGYVEEITDDIPEGLEFLPDHPVNKEYRWKEVNGKVYSDYRGKGKPGEKLLKNFDIVNGTQVDYTDYEIVFKVKDGVKVDEAIINTAEITKHRDKDGKEIEDRDSIPNNNKKGEDDIDTEGIIPKKPELFDLALRKFISKINGENLVTSREPQVDVSPFGQGKTTAKYTHPKDKVYVKDGDKVEYILRIYNEGNVDGYANSVVDTIPEGLTFDKDDETNKKYLWEEREGKIYSKYISKDEDGKHGESVLLKAFNGQTLHYVDLKVVFKVKEDVYKNRDKLKNIAEIAEHQGKDKEVVNDRDSVPNNNKSDEDDIDYEDLKPAIFDLALIKLISKYEIIGGSNPGVVETNHTEANNNPEPIVKIDLKKEDISKVDIKYTYTIRIKNEGTVEGTASEITDYIPEGLKFVKEDNPLWTVDATDERIVKTEQLKDVVIKPGEYKDIEIVLTWDKTVKKFGQMTNLAEISKDKNPHNLKDIDSIPNNKKSGEDDIDDASVLLSIATGKMETFYIITLTTLTLVGTSLFSIKKYVA